MIRKTMRIRGLRTSIKLEQEFWSYLTEIAAGRRMRLSALVNEVAEATPGHTNLASTLRTFALSHARQRTREETAAPPGASRAGRHHGCGPSYPSMTRMSASEAAVRSAFTGWYSGDS
jgi:predicted DNA-binding ribbon-helix-helix protein